MPPDEPKYNVFQENQTLGKRNNIVRKVNRFKKYFISNVLLMNDFAVFIIIFLLRY
jgi:hypothetical protein